MIATWMLYTLLVGALVVTAARCAESLLRLLGRPARWVWAAALVAAIALPIVTALAPAPRLDGTAAAAATHGPAITREPIAVTLATAPAARSLDRPLLLGWAGVTAILLVAMVHSIRVLRQRRREWSRHEVNGRNLLVAGDTGPAVIGWRRMEVVIPSWVLGLGHDARALILAHEDEHIRARDPLLMLAGLLAAMLLPWNLPLWYAWRRLRTTIELDCDARVLARGTDPRAYGELLLTASRYGGSAHLPALATFAERTDQLEERLSALAPRSVRRRGARVVGAGAAGAMLLAAACTMDNPLGVDLADPAGGPSYRWSYTVPPGAFRPVVLAGESRNRILRDIVHRMVEQRFPGASQAGGTTEPVVALFLLYPDRRLLSATLQVGLRAPEAEIPLESPRGNQIESIEVLDGGVVGFDNVGVIVVQLRQPGESASLGRSTPTGNTAEERQIGSDWVSAGYIGQAPR